MQEKNINKKKAQLILPAHTSASRTKLFFIVGAVALTTLFSFAPAMKNSFINQDDDIYVFENANLGKPIGEAVGYFFEPHYFAGNYIPVTMISYSLVYHIAGAEPELFHTVSMLIHLLNVALVFWFIYLLSGRKPVVAAIVSLFFGIHPMHVESVAWVAELKDVLYTCFFIAGLVAYQYYLEWRNEQSSNDKNGMFRLRGLAFILFVFSCLSKPAAIVFPVVLLLLDFYNARKFEKQVLIEKIPFFIVSVIIGIVAIKAQHADNLINNYYPFAQRLLFASYAILHYLFKFLFPVSLSSFYPYPVPVDGHLPYVYYVLPAVVIALLYGVYKTLRYSRIIVFGFLFFLINLVLVLQLISVGNAIVADRYTYVPYIGLLFIVAMGFDWIYHSTSHKISKYKQVAMGVIIVFALCCSFLTYARCEVWKDQDTVSLDVLDKFPDDPIALNNRGYLLFREGKYQESIPLFVKIIQLKPDYENQYYIKAYVNLVNSYIALNDYDNALKTANEALAHDPQNYNLLNTKGYLLFRQKKYTEAIQLYQQAIQIREDFINGYLNLAECYYVLQDYDNQIKTIDTALKYEPDNYILLNNKGYALFLKGKYEEALVYLKASLKIKPDYAIALGNLSNCYRAMNDSSQVKQ